MHIAIDDTYGMAGSGKSKYVTTTRRTHVAVVFPDEEVVYIREQIKECLDLIKCQTGISAKEFHFSEIYNRTGPWERLKQGNDPLNIRIFEFFADIYSKYRWPVHIQTIDDRTLRDHGVAQIDVKVDGLDLKKREDLSLFFLLVKIKDVYKKNQQPINLLIDEGRCKPGVAFGHKIFRDWPEKFSGAYQSSEFEPLLQIADFIAFCVNRVTHISLKEPRTNQDNWFIELATSMKINCPDLMSVVVREDFSPSDIDAIHTVDRVKKGLEKAG